jgi:hypothetical protein
LCWKGCSFFLATCRGARGLYRHLGAWEGVGEASELACMPQVCKQYVDIARALCFLHCTCSNKRNECCQSVILPLKVFVHMMIRRLLRLYCLLRRYEYQVAVLGICTACLHVRFRIRFSVRFACKSNGDTILCPISNPTPIDPYPPRTRNC